MIPPKTWPIMLLAWHKPQMCTNVANTCHFFTSNCSRSAYLREKSNSKLTKTSNTQYNTPQTQKRKSMQLIPLLCLFETLRYYPVRCWTPRRYTFHPVILGFAPKLGTIRTTAIAHLRNVVAVAKKLFSIIKVSKDETCKNGQLHSNFAICHMLGMLNVLNVCVGLGWRSLSELLGAFFPGLDASSQPFGREHHEGLLRIRLSTKRKLLAGLAKGPNIRTTMDTTA